MNGDGQTVRLMLALCFGSALMGMHGVRELFCASGLIVVVNSRLVATNMTTQVPRM